MQSFTMPSSAQPSVFYAAIDRLEPVGWGKSLQFIDLLNAFRPSGGLARSDETLELFMRRGGPNLSTVARWIARREVVCLDWNAQSWMPIFQWDLVDMVPLPQLALVVAELNAVYPPWALAAWFARPNAWLGSERPADVLLSHGGEVVDAARAARFAALG